jgi:hypothetical protein
MALDFTNGGDRAMGSTKDSCDARKRRGEWGEAATEDTSEHNAGDGVI